MTFFKVQLKIYLLSPLFQSDYDYILFIISAVWTKFTKHNSLFWQSLVLDANDWAEHEFRMLSTDKVLSTEQGRKLVDLTEFVPFISPP